MNRRDEILEELEEALREREPATGQALRAAQREHRQAMPSRPLFPRLMPAGASLALVGALCLSVLTQRATTPPIVTRPIGDPGAQVALAPPKLKTQPNPPASARTHPSPPLRQGRAGEERAGVGSEAWVGSDDLAYLNEGASTDAYANRSAGFVRSDADALLQQVPLMAAGDGFVEVPLPQLAAESKAANAAAIRLYQDEKAIQDPRLQRRVTLAKKAISFGALLEQLAKETGVDISATRGVADDKLTVFCKDKPLRDLLRQITQHFGFVWERTGSDPAFAYRLKQPMRNQFLEEELRNKDRNEALLALDREMESLKRHFALSPEQARLAAESAEGKERDQLELLGGLGWGPARLYFGLSPDDQSTLQSGKQLYYGPKGASLPKELENGILSSLTGHAFIDGNSISMTNNRKAAAEAKMAGKSPADMGAKPAAMLQMQRDELGQVSLIAHTGFSQGGGAAMSGVPLATGISPSASSPKNAEANAAKKTEPAYQKPTELVGEAHTDSKGVKKWTSAEALEAIHKATGKDVIGDYFTRLVAQPALKGTLFEVLARTCDPLRLRWEEHEGWLTFRSTDFFNMRLKEVPGRLLERWAAQRKVAKKLSPEDLRELSRLTNDQLDASSMAEGAKELYGLVEWDMVRSETTRPIWRFYDSLSTPLRNAMLSDKGINFSQLSLDGRQKFIKAAYQHNPDRITEIQQGGVSEEFLKRLETSSQLRLVPGSEAANDSFAFEFVVPADFGSGLMRKRVSNGGTSISSNN